MFSSSVDCRHNRQTGSREVALCKEEVDEVTVLFLGFPRFKLVGEKMSASVSAVEANSGESRCGSIGKLGLEFGGETLGVGKRKK